MKLRNNQRKACKKIASAILSNIAKTIGFFAPTGVGKTIITGKAIQAVVKNKKDHYCFIDVAPNKLHLQWYDKLSALFPGDIKVSKLEFGLNPSKFTDSVFVVNWESIQPKTRMRKKNEKNWTFQSFCNKVHKYSSKVVAIIDESHIRSKTDNSKEILDIIKPDILIRMTATPKTENCDLKIELSIPEGIQDELLKKQLIYNSDIEYNLNNKTDYDNEEAMIKTAIEKQIYITNLATKLGLDYVPLIMNCLANGVSSRKNEIVALYKKHGIKDDEIAIWLSDEHINIVDINTNKIKVLFFKQAIATGWDCPRAQILVLLREFKSEILSHQIVGRITRAYGVKHYNNDVMDSGFIYMLVENPSIDDMIDKYVQTGSISNNLRQEVAAMNIKLNAQNIYRVRDSQPFNEVLFDKVFADKLKLSELYKFILKSGNVNPTSTLVCNEVYDCATGNVKHNSHTFTDKPSEIDKKYIMRIQRLANKINRKKDTTIIVDRIIPILNLLQISLDIFKRAIISLSGKSLFDEFCTNVREEYFAQNKNRSGNILQDFVWEPNKLIINEIFCSKSFTINNIYKKCIMSPCIIPIRITGYERKFIEYCEASILVKYWYKQGDKDKKYFGVVYVNKDGKLAKFHPDFIIIDSNDNIHIVEIKGQHILDDKDTISKMNMLHQHLQNQCPNTSAFIAVLDGDTWSHNSGDIADKTQWKAGLPL